MSFIHLCLNMFLIFFLTFKCILSFLFSFYLLSPAPSLFSALSCLSNRSPLLSLLSLDLLLPSSYHSLCLFFCSPPQAELIQGVG